MRPGAGRPGRCHPSPRVRPSASRSVMPSRMLAVPRSTLALATALDVAITVMMLVAMAWCIGTPRPMTSTGMRKTPPPVPRIAPSSPVTTPASATQRYPNGVKCMERPKCRGDKRPGQSFGDGVRVDQHPGRRLAVGVVELADRPEQAVRDQIQVVRVADQGIVVPQRGGEHLRLAVVGIGPGDHEIADGFLAVASFGRLLAARQRLSCLQQFAGAVV